jgi:hypothetical protein
MQGAARQEGPESQTRGAASQEGLGIQMQGAAGQEGPWSQMQGASFQEGQLGQMQGAASQEGLRVWRLDPEQATAPGGSTGILTATALSDTGLMNHELVQ